MLNEKPPSALADGGFLGVQGWGLPEYPATKVAGLGDFVSHPFLFGHGRA